MKIFNYQSGFRANHSTTLCLSFLTDKSLRRFNEVMLTGMILMDLLKVFDTIDYEILLQKLKPIEFLKGTLEWFRSYLSEQIFFVNTECKLSDFGKISFGVPQGSQAVESTLLLYADDSCILYQHKVDEIEKQLNKSFLLKA